MRVKTRTIIVAGALMLLLAAPFAVSQDSASLDKYSDGFSAFAEEVANSLPLNATIGLNTPEAYVGQLLEFPPSVGVGVTVGASTIPFSTVQNTFDTLGIGIPSELNQLKDFGFPFPAAAVDARVGGILIPFDAGLKVGKLVKPLKEFVPKGMSADYLLAGADVRFPLAQGRNFGFSVGGGYNYLRGEIGIQDVIDTGYTIDLSDYYPTYTDFQQLVLEAPDANFSFKSNSIDAKAQISKKILFLTPYAGAGASLSRSSAGGALKAQLTDGTNALTDEEIEQLKEDLRTIEKNTPDTDFNIEQIGDQGLSVSQKVTGWSFRVFGGTSLHILFLHLDLGLGYDLVGKNFRGTIGLRVQL